MKNINKHMIIILLIGLILLLGCSYYMCVVAAIDVYKVHFIYQAIIIPVFFLISCYLYSKKYDDGKILLTILSIMEIINVFLFYSDSSISLVYSIFSILLGLIGIILGKPDNN